MTLHIDPTTERGKNYIEAIKWSQDQMNEILKRYFAGGYRIMKGLYLEFLIKTDTGVQEDVKVNISELAPHTKDALQKAVEEATRNANIIEPSTIKDAEIVTEQKKEEEKHYGTGKK